MHFEECLLFLFLSCSTSRKEFPITMAVYARTARLSDKTGKFSFCPAENCSLSDKRPATLCKSQILIIDMFCDF